LRLIPFAAVSAVTPSHPLPASQCHHMTESMWILQPDGSMAPSPKSPIISVEETNQSGARLGSKKRIGGQIAEQLTLENFYPGLHHALPDIAKVSLKTLDLTVAITNAMHVDPSFFCMLAILGKHPRLEGRLPGLNEAAMKIMDVKEHGEEWRIYGAVLLVKHSSSMPKVRLISSTSKSKMKNKYMPLSEDSLGMLKAKFGHLKVNDVLVAPPSTHGPNVGNTSRGSVSSNATPWHQLEDFPSDIAVEAAMDNLPALAAREWPALIGSPPGLTSRASPNLETHTSAIEQAGLHDMKDVLPSLPSDGEQADAGATIAAACSNAAAASSNGTLQPASVAEATNAEVGAKTIIGLAMQSESEDLVEEHLFHGDHQEADLADVPEENKNDSETCGDTGSSGKPDALSEDGTGSTTSDIRRVLRRNGDAFEHENKFRLKMAAKHQKNFPNASDLIRFLRDSVLTDDLNEYMVLKKAKDAASHPSGAYSSKTALALVDENATAEGEQSYKMEKLKNSIEHIPYVKQWPGNKTIMDIKNNGSWQDRLALKSLCLVLTLNTPVQPQKLVLEMAFSLQLSLPCPPLVSYPPTPPYVATIAFGTVEDRSRFEHGQTRLSHIIEKVEVFRYFYKVKPNTVFWLNVSMSDLTEHDIASYLEQQYGSIHNVWVYAYHDQEAGQQKPKNGFVEFTDASSAQMLLADCHQLCQPNRNPCQVIRLGDALLACNGGKAPAAPYYDDPRARLELASASSAAGAVACEVLEPQAASPAKKDAEDLKVADAMQTPTNKPEAALGSTPSAPVAAPVASIVSPVCSAAELLPEASPSDDEAISSATEPAERTSDVGSAGEKLTEPEKVEQSVGQVAVPCLVPGAAGVKSLSSLVLVQIMFQGKSERARLLSSRKIAELPAEYEQWIRRILQEAQPAELALKVCDHDGVRYDSAVSIGFLQGEAAQAGTLNVKDGSLSLYIEHWC